MNLSAAHYFTRPERQGNPETDLATPTWSPFEKSMLAATLLCSAVLVRSPAEHPIQAVAGIALPFAMNPVRKAVMSSIYVQTVLTPDTTPSSPPNLRIVS